jgi:hypothetical protein
MANALFAWAHDRGAPGPYYLISPKNAPSIAFVERGGGRWPVDVSIVSIDPSAAAGPTPALIPSHLIPEAARLVNATHDGQDFFEPLSAESLAERSRWAPLYGVTVGSRLVAIAGLWDRGAATQRIQHNRSTGVQTRSREATVTDWGWAPGHEQDCADLLHSLASEACGLARNSLTFCEPFPGALPMPALDWRRTNVALFTPGLPPPSPQDITGIFIDMLYI